MDGPPSSAESPHLRVLAQYVKDLSFQNPMAAGSARAYETQPTIDMGVEVKSRRISEPGDVFEIEMAEFGASLRNRLARSATGFAYGGVASL